MCNFYKFIIIIGCSLSLRAQVPTATIASLSSIFCSDTHIFFAAKTSNAPTSFTWALLPNKGGAFVSQINDSSVVCTFSTPGNYLLSIGLSNANGTSTATRQITVTKSAVAAFNASLNTVGFPNTLSLTDYSSNNSKHYWLFSNTALKDSVDFLQVNYGLSGSYSVSLVALGTNGCNDTLTYPFQDIRFLIGYPSKHIYTK